SWPTLYKWTAGSVIPGNPVIWTTWPSGGSSGWDAAVRPSVSLRRHRRNRPTAGRGRGTRCLPLAVRRWWCCSVAVLLVPRAGADVACCLLHGLRGGGDAQLAGGEVGCLVGHAVALVGTVRGPVQTTGVADRVTGGAQLQRLGGVERTDGDRRGAAVQQVQDAGGRRAEQ